MMTDWVITAPTKMQITVSRMRSVAALRMSGTSSVWLSYTFAAIAMAPAKAEAVL
jgi:hypothetical protein